MKEFNIVLTGVGGQGILTLGIIIAEAALKQGYDVRTTELHGLAQRGGSIPVHVRFGKKMYTPLVLEGEANLIVSLEPLEGLRFCYYGSKKHKTIFLIDNDPVIPLSCSILGEKYPSIEEIKNNLKDFSEKVIVLNASEIVKKETGSDIAANIYLLGYAVSKKLIPLKEKFIIQAMQEIAPKYFEINKKIFDLGKVNR
ncbi:MAG: indolepyruvate oxidoreductase subunit beta [Candidatus Aenigmatarchaeota archaeon]